MTLNMLGTRISRFLFRSAGQTVSMNGLAQLFEFQLVSGSPQNEARVWRLAFGGIRDLGAERITLTD